MTQHPEIIEDEIARIRNRMEARMESLNANLSPSQLVSGLLQQDTIDTKAALSQVVTQARANPLATAFIGAGLASLFLSGNKSNTTAYDGDALAGAADDRVASGVASLRASALDARDTAAIKSSVAKAKLKGKAFAAKEALEDVSQKVSEGAENLVDKASETFDGAKKTARLAPVQARAKAEGAADWVKENPVPAGLMALAAGAALSSFFTARSTTSRLDASKQLHEEARNHGEGTGHAVAEPLVKPKAKAKKKASSKPKAASAKMKSKPISTRTAKARTMAGKPETAPKSVATLNGSTQHGG